LECGKRITILFKNPSNLKDHESHKTIEQTVKSQNCQIVKTAKMNKMKKRQGRVDHHKATIAKRGMV